jgi:DNA repair protein RecN (Recombination protein N)
MLRELRVRNLALIREVSMEFSPGLNVLTGETGAGKTVLVEALGLLLGARGDSAMVRPGAERMELEAVFEAGSDEVKARLEELGLGGEEDEIIIRRSLSSDGKGRCYVNDRLCTVKTLSLLGELLVDIHGQHEHQRLLRPFCHLQYLDDYGDTAHRQLLRDYREQYRRWRTARDTLARLAVAEEERFREMDLLRYQIREIEKVGPREGELEELALERRRMQGREELFSAVSGAYDLVYGVDSTGVLDALGEAAALLERVSPLDGTPARWGRDLLELQERLAETCREMRDYLDGLEFQPERVEEVERRYHQLSELARKYGRDTASILEFLEAARRRLEELENLDMAREGLEGEVRELEQGLEDLAQRLGESRRCLATRLEEEVNRELSELRMGGVRFRVEVRRREGWAETGAEDVEFMISPGRNMPFRPVARIASGGELARITLALKLALARADFVPTLVFDEIDAGIGGETADVLAEKLHRVASYHQVFVVTHLPQVAAMAGRHFLVTKMAGRGSPSTSVKALRGDERLEELSRMLGGGRDTAREHALSLLRRGEDLALASGSGERTRQEAG